MGWSSKYWFLMSVVNFIFLFVTWVAPPLPRKPVTTRMLLLGSGIPKQKTWFATTNYTGMWDDSRCRQLFSLAPSHSSSKKSWENGARCQDSGLMNTGPTPEKNLCHQRPPPHRKVGKTKTPWRSIWIQNLVAVVSGSSIFFCFEGVTFPSKRWQF